MTTHISPELAETARELGIDPSQLSGVGGGPSVYLGPGASETPLAEPQERNRLTDETSPVSEMLSDVLKMAEDKPAQFRRLQQRLFDGGFYGRTSESSINWGSPDDLTISAYDKLLNTAAAYYEAGVDKTPDDVLDEFARNRQQNVEDGAGAAGKVGGGGVYTVSLSDPAALRQLADTVSREVLGERASPEMQAKVASAIRQAQSSSQTSVADAQERSRQARYETEDGYIAPETVAAEQVDPQARATEMIRSSDPLGAAGMAAGDGYRTFLQLLRPGGIG